MYRLIGIICCFVGNVILLNAQCINTVQWPTGTIMGPIAGGYSKIIAVDNKSIDFALVDNIYAGQIYEITSDIKTDFLTIIEQSTNTTVSFGGVPLYVSAPITGPTTATWEIHITADMSCATDSYERETTIRCITCPPINDECTTPIELQVGEDLTCDYKERGVLSSATNSINAPSCIGTPIQDTWFSFTANNNTHVLIFEPFNNGVAVDYEFMVGSDCNTLTSIFCDNALFKEVNGLLPGNEYYVRVYQDMMNPNGNVDFFEICVDTYTPPTDVYIDPISTTAASVNWTIGNGPVVSTTVTLCPYNIPFGDGSCQTFMNTDGTPHEFTGLTSCTSYDVYLQEVYSTGGTSTLVGPYSFQTDGFLNDNPVCGDVIVYPPCPDTDHYIEDNVIFNICPSGSERVTVTFSHFDIETSIGVGLDGNGCWDYLEIVDNGVPLGTFCSEASGDGDVPFNSAADLSLQPTFMAATPGTCMTITLVADGIVQETAIQFTVGCIEECPDDLYVPSPLSSTYAANLNVSSDGTILNGENVIMEANCVELQSGFEVELGAIFLGHINPCAASNLGEVEEQ